MVVEAETLVGGVVVSIVPSPPVAKVVTLAADEKKSDRTPALSAGIVHSIHRQKAQHQAQP